LILGEAVFRACAPTGGPDGISPRQAQASPVKCGGLTAALAGVQGVCAGWGGSAEI